MTEPYLPPSGEEGLGATTPTFANAIVRWGLSQPFLVSLFALTLIGVGAWSFSRLPVDAYPDLSAPIVEIITPWPGHAAEEVERLITVPLETEMNGVEQVKVVRSISLYGLSDVIMTFQDNADKYFVRQLVFERLPNATLPNNVTPSVAPLSSPSGLIYRYVMESPDRSAMELKIIDDWVIAKALKGVAGVADITPLGGESMQYQVLLNPNKLAAAGLAATDVETALGANNANAGGGFYSEGGQFYYIRGLALLSTTQDIADVVVSTKNGIPILVKDLGTVEIGYAPRLGQFGYNDRNDAVEGIVLLLTGAQAQTVLKGVEAKVNYLNDSVLPKDVKIHPFYDRTDLIHTTTRTVEDNLLRGVVFVVIILVFFLYDVRSGLIVATTIPLALLFAFICLDVKNIPANLLSIGAIDFGIIVDGAVVMVENIHRQLARRHGSAFSVREVIAAAAAEVDRPIVYAVAVIVAGFLPIYVLSGPSGLLFKPMASTTIFALIGSLLLTLTVLPVLCVWVLGNRVKDRRNVVFEAIRSGYARALDWSLRNRTIVISTSVILFGLSLFLTTRIGAEFMPKLDEGAIWVRATMPYTISFEESSRIVPEIRKVLASFPEVTTVGSEHGRDDSGTDPTGFFNAEFFVGLKPYSEWTGPYRKKQELIDRIDAKLAQFPGITFNYTQPAEDAVDEAETGLKSSLDLKLFGNDLTVLETKGRQIKDVMSHVPGITDLTLVQELGQPALTVQVDRQKLAHYGLSAATINSLITVAVGGDVATQMVQGEELFDLVVRLQPEFRRTPEEIGNILVATPTGGEIPLHEVATLSISNGASFIYRQGNARYIGVQFSVSGRDLAGAVQDAQRQVAAQVKLPPGYHAVWGGEFQEYTESRTQLEIVLPITLGLIFLLLFFLYSNIKFPVITVLGVLLSGPIGGMVALIVTGTHFSVSSGIGFLALFGVSVQTAVVYISYANELRLSGSGIAEATREAALLRLRPIMMTALVAALGLLPAALSTGVGSDSQKPFALVIVGGLFSRLLITVFLMPVLYVVVAREGDHLEV